MRGSPAGLIRRIFPRLRAEVLARLERVAAAATVAEPDVEEARRDRTGAGRRCGSRTCGAPGRRTVRALRLRARLRRPLNSTTLDVARRCPCSRRRSAGSCGSSGANAIDRRPRSPPDWTRSRMSRYGRARVCARAGPRGSCRPARRRTAGVRSPGGAVTYVGFEKVPTRRRFSPVTAVSAAPSSARSARGRRLGDGHRRRRFVIGAVAGRERGHGEEHGGASPGGHAPQDARVPNRESTRDRGDRFVGGRLAERLAADGVEVRCLVRDEGRARHLAAAGHELHEGDVTRPETLRGAGDGIDVAYYLVHGMGRGRERRLRAAGAPLGRGVRGHGRSGGGRASRLSRRARRRRRARSTSAAGTRRLSSLARRAHR